MKKTMVLYYSRTGSNRYLAEKIAAELTCNSEPLRPRLPFFPFMLLSSATGIGLGTAKPKHDLSAYDRIIIVTPIWMGQVIQPLRDTVRRLKNVSAELHFVTSCGSVDDKKDETFGYGLVFKKLADLAAPQTVTCTALPVALVVPKDKWDDGQAIMNTRLSDANFAGAIRERFDALIGSLRA